MAETWAAVREEQAMTLVRTLRSIAAAGHRRDVRPLLCSLPFVLLTSTTLWARSPWVAELQTVATSYHHDPARLDQVREGLEQAIKTDPQVENLVALGWVSFIWGDIRAATRAQKLAAYERGRQAAKRAAALDPRNPEAHFWYAINTACWGQTKGIVRALFLLPTVQTVHRTLRRLDGVQKLRQGAVVASHGWLRRALLRRCPRGIRSQMPRCDGAS
jgi:cytochrome c-type biogenesis protein CcmH/NrfG